MLWTLRTRSFKINGSIGHTDSAWKTMAIMMPKIIKIMNLLIQFWCYLTIELWPNILNIKLVASNRTDSSLDWYINRSIDRSIKVPLAPSVLSRKIEFHFFFTCWSLWNNKKPSRRLGNPCSTKFVVIFFEQKKC